MAKKKRKPRRRPQGQAGAGAVRTAERTGRPRTERAAPPSTRTARAEKKELARQQREEVRRRIRRAELARRVVWITGIGAVVALAVFWFTRPGDRAERPSTLPGELTSEAPWPPNGAQAPERARAIALPPEGTAQHVHANVQVFVHGEREPVPQNIGIDEASGEVLSIHTHEGSGTVHIESRDAGHVSTLGEFFDVWGVRFTETCLGAYCGEGQDALKVFKAGQEVSGPLRDVTLDDHAVIVVTFGTDDELPSPIPSTFDFSSVPQ
ncbi:MAG TPA: hypothetical protein VE669_12470 [Actinomycetota bacterium]|jgi:hypothetical protein|nr:hypothetical protein [Actinomycetota bacterium]